MPPAAICPVSEVDRALSPYINTREDTLRMRRTLSKYLTANIRPVNSATQNLHLNHECPQNLSASNTASPGLKETRLAYLQALRARIQAQAKHQELQTFLDGLQNHHIIEAPVHNESDYDGEVIREYVNLLHQRRRFSELQVIQDTVEKLLNAHPTSRDKDPKSLVKEFIGEQPDLPAERLEQLSRVQGDDRLLLKLKKEVLEAKVSMDRANASKTEAHSAFIGAFSLGQQVYALGCAREEIVEWVQGELMKLEEESGFLEDASPIKRSAPERPVLDSTSSEADIQSSYDRYTKSRSTLIKAYKSCQQASPATIERPTDFRAPLHTTGYPKELLSSAKIITSILPYIPYLTQMSGNERTLLQQAVYLQSQIASADDETAERLLRLAGESHLLPSGSKDAMAWAKTAAEVGAATQSFIKGQLQESRQEVSYISTMVDLCSLQSKVLGSR